MNKRILILLAVICFSSIGAINRYKVITEKNFPTASDSVLGGIKVGTGLSITSGVLSATSVGYTNLTSFVAQTNWRLFYSNGSGDVTELAFGSDGEYLKSNGASAAPSWATPSGAAHDAVTLAGQDYLTLSTQQITANLINGDNINWATTTDLTTNGAVAWGNIAEGELADSTVVSADIKDGTIAGADLASNIAITSTGVQDFGGATSFEIPNGTAPTVDAAGEIAVDTTDDQLIYYGAAKRVIPYERTVCVGLENLAATDDNFAFWMANDAVTVTGVGCNCRGTCTTTATFTLEDRGGNAMTITDTNPTCATTGAATFKTVTSGNQLTAGEMIAFDVTNTPTAGDTYVLCFTHAVDAQ